LASFGVPRSSASLGRPRVASSTRSFRVAPVPTAPAARLPLLRPGYRSLLRASGEPPRSRHYVGRGHSQRHANRGKRSAGSLKQATAPERGVNPTASTTPRLRRRSAPGPPALEIPARSPFARKTSEKGRSGLDLGPIAAIVIATVAVAGRRGLPVLICSSGRTRDRSEAHTHTRRRQSEALPRTLRQPPSEAGGGGRLTLGES
jgi:hypothetical protein